MAINPKLIVTSDLESYYVDKDSGVPLAGGIITFYSDVSRMTKKPVYQITGSPPNYTYSELPNPCVLSDVGTFQDELGNNIVPYYYPYQGAPDDATPSSDVDLYYITVTSSGGVQQFTREAWPNFEGAGSANATTDATNYIPNGQFLVHNELVSVTQPPVTAYTFGAGSVDSQPIAQGGWSFVRTTGGTSTFDNSFEEITSAVSELFDFPRWAFNFKCSSFVADDTTRDLQIQWRDVNKFTIGDPQGTQPFTLTFAAMSNTVSSYTFSIYLQRYYGTGGTPTTSTSDLLTTVTIDANYGLYAIDIPGFPDDGGTVGTNGDDYVAISIRGPAAGWDAQFTDFSLLLGDVTVDIFPIQTNAQMLAESVAGWMPNPNPDGSDLYLPLILTQSGMIFDDTNIGNISASVKVGGAGSTELLCDGAGYNSSEYSTVGIPYSRLFDKLYSASYLAPIFGTGYNFFDAYVSLTGTSSVRLSTNKAGAQTVSSDTSTTFTVINMRTGQATANVTGYMRATGTVLVKGNFKGAVTAPAAGTSGATVATIDNNANVYLVFTVVFGGAPGAGTYFTFRSSANNGAGTNDSYYVWYQVDEAGADPAPGGTGILVDIKSTWGVAEIAQATKEAIIGAQTSYITTVAASSIVQSSYLSVYANSQQYVVWMNKDGAGVKPVVANAKYIPVTVTTGDSAATVATNLTIALNSVAVGVPDMRGLVLRGLDSSTAPAWDLDIATRMSNLSNLIGAGIGTIELDELEYHNHTTTTTSSAGNTSIPAAPYYVHSDVISVGPITFAEPSSFVGGSESRPANMAVNYYIKY